MPELTPAGRQAQQILGWAYQDLPGRLAEARKRAGALWTAEQDPKAKREIGDVATQLSRLADSSRSLSDNTIAAQLRSTG